MKTFKVGHSPKLDDLSRRAMIKGAVGLAGAATIGSGIPWSLSGLAAGIPVRQDITQFAQDAIRLANFEAAIKEMQDRSNRDPNDPKGWLVNANAHRDFCAVPRPSDPTQIHFCWWFLPWHRAYIAVIERKIRELAGDPTLAYPYWNWSNDRRIPHPYAHAGSPLADAVRYTPNRAVQDGEVDYFPNDPNRESLGVAALGASFFEAKTRTQIGHSFGGIARPNSANAYDNNRLEGVPHGPIHVYVGGVKDPTDPNSDVGDMTDFETAARDPIFFAHHGNLDRLWERWRQDPAHKSTEPSTDAFLNHAFVFTWLDGTPMQITVKETLDIATLGYSYDTLEVFRPGAEVMVAAQAAEGPLPAIAKDKVSVPLMPQGVGENERRILEITDVQKPDRVMTVGVYIKPATAPVDEPGTNVGTFSAVRSGGEVAWPSNTLSFDITDTANKYAGQELTVELIPYRIRAQGAESYPPLKYGQMHIVTEK